MKFKIPFEDIKSEVLGEKYELSLVFIDNKASRRLNRVHRGKDKSTNILSFPLSKDSGEIFIDLEQAKKEMRDFGKSFPDFVLFLFIHGLFHLKGMDHGARMERAEKRIFDKFTNGSSNRSRH